METDTLTAGPEMDAEVARLVFGVRYFKAPYCVINGRREDVETWFIEGHGFGPDDPPGGYTWGVKPPPYSTDVAEAMEVFEAVVEMTGDGYISADMEDCRGEGFVCSVRFDIAGVSASGPLPEAICRAALAAMQEPNSPAAPARQAES